MCELLHSYFALNFNAKHRKKKKWMLNTKYSSRHIQCNLFLLLIIVLGLLF